MIYENEVCSFTVSGSGSCNEASAKNIGEIVGAKVKLEYTDFYHLHGRMHVIGKPTDNHKDIFEKTKGVAPHATLSR